MGGPSNSEHRQTLPHVFLADHSHDKAAPQPGFRMKSQPGGVGEGVNHLPHPPVAWQKSCAGQRSSVVSPQPACSASQPSPGLSHHHPCSTLSCINSCGTRGSLFQEPPFPLRQPLKSAPKRMVQKPHSYVPTASELIPV